MSNKPFNFEYSYLSLPDTFYSLVKPMPAGKPELVKLNTALCAELNISLSNPNDILSALFNGENTSAFAQAYAGHQFGHFTRLGDGRAIILGEHISHHNKRFDIQLKGSGKTPYSRGGDGKATLKSMLREYVISEAMHYLKIPTSRSLAVIKTGEPVYRETTQEGAVLARMMKSHIRIGTFEYARYFGTPDDVKALLKYSVNRIHPEIEQMENHALGLLHKVMAEQIELLANWMRVGFIHGVMNTDNVSISGETFDYGPCAFLNAYHPDTVYSSIDLGRRYAFGNQAGIMKWNIARFAEALLPAIHPSADTAIELAQEVIDKFDSLWSATYYETMLNKIGVEDGSPALFPLVDELLELMTQLKSDYTNTFWALSQSEDSSLNRPEFLPWLEKWRSFLKNPSHAKALMRETNPVYIPRNHLVEKALDDAVKGNFRRFDELMGILATPYTFKANKEEYGRPPDTGFDIGYRTFCGT